ncbi:MAG: exodeoxyribonuclease V subunit gamma [Acidobacteriota bacterium]
MPRAVLDIHTSNRLDVLVEHLAQTLAADPLPPLEREVVVVQSQGMYRWVSLQLADRLGIAASLRMPYPGAFCHRLADQLEQAGDVAYDDWQPATSLFDRDLLTWRIFEHLPSVLELRTELTGAAPYLADDAQGVKRYQLASRLASLFEDYQLFRPEMMLTWESAAEASPRSAGPEPAKISAEMSPEVAWQASLWRALNRGPQAEPTQQPDDAPSEEHLARRFTRLLEALRQAEAPPVALPRRLSVFGVSTLPPIFIDVAVALARFIPVRIYFTSPTYHYWGDLRSDREAARIRRRQRGDQASGVEDHFERGHALLAGLGRQGREFFNLLQAADTEGTAWHELDFVDPGDDTLLHALQSDILHLADAGTVDIDGDTAGRRQLSRDDDSLSLHVCHSPRREMEVLRDQLLDAFERDPRLRPSDVLVMVPDITTYSPYIEAVFGVEWEGTPRLPFTIADRYVAQEQPTAETILQILDLVAGRMLPSDLLDLLDTPAIRRRFGIAASDVPLLRQWIEAAGIRWGMDGTQRHSDFALPPDSANSWRAGLDRLLMGYATGDPGELVAGIAPYAGDTSGNAELLGCLNDFAETLFKHLEALRESRPAQLWARALAGLLDDLYQPESEAEESALEHLRESFEKLAQADLLAGLTTPLELAVVRAHLRRQLTHSGSVTGFISGRITFCALKPMRSIPFEIICIAGLDEGAFPRRDTRHGFDLMARDPRPGDRSLREDDRYLFLETLLSARQRLILSYQGRSQKDNRTRAPSVVVSELLDALDGAFVAPEGTTLRDLLVVDHRLHPFSQDYYDPAASDRLFSYAQDNYQASRGYGGEGVETPFLPGETASRPLRAVDPDMPQIEVELRDLIDHWLNPARHFCRHVLQLTLDFSPRASEEAEPFAVDFLDRYRINQWLLGRRLGSEADASDELELLRARGELPLKHLGTAHYDRLDDQVASFAATLPAFTPLDPVLIELQGVGWRLHGRLDTLTDIGGLSFRCAQLKPKDLLRAWILHLAHNVWEAEHPMDLPVTTRVIGTDRGIRFRALEHAEQILDRLIAGYARGAERPLPVFERASHAYAQHQRRLADPRSRSRTPALEAARRAWSGERFAGDLDDPYVALCFRDLDPLADEAFTYWAQQLWEPLLTHAEEIDTG